MAVTTRLIDRSDFTDRVNISNKRTLERVNTNIGLVQEKYLKNLLCTTLYDDLVAQYAEGGEAYMDERLQDLYPFVVDFLVFKTYQRYTVGNNVLDSASGMRVKSDNEVDRAATTKELQMIRKQAESDADYYQDELINFLQRNKETYNDWADSICGNCESKFSRITKISRVGYKRNEIVSKNRIDYT